MRVLVDFGVVLNFEPKAQLEWCVTSTKKGCYHVFYHKEKVK